MVYLNCQCSSVLCLSLTLFKIAWWSSAGKVLSPWLSALAVFILCNLGCLCVPFALGVWDRMWSSIVSVPDLYLFIYSTLV